MKEANTWINLSHSCLTLRASGFVTFGNCGAFVVGLLAFGQCYLDLGATILEIDTKWNHGHAFDTDVVPHFADLFFMQKQTSLATRFMVEAAGLFVGSDVCFEQPGLLAILNIYIRFLDADLSGANRLDLAALQFETCFKLLHQKIFKTRLAVGG